MKFPDEMLQICRNMHQDIGLICKSDHELVATALFGLDSKQRQSVKAFLDELFDRQGDPDLIENCWDASPAEVHFGNSEQLMWFLEKVRAAVAKSKGKFTSILPMRLSPPYLALKEIVAFIRAGGKRSLCTPRDATQASDLVEEVNQVRKYRNWVSHGKRGERPDNVEPPMAFDRLRRFLQFLDNLDS